MAAADPESMKVLAQVIGAGAAVVVPVWAVRNWIEGRLGKKLEKDDFKEFIQRFDQHVRDDRETQAKLFDKVDEVKTILLERKE